MPQYGLICRKFALLAGRTDQLGPRADPKRPQKNRRKLPFFCLGATWGHQKALIDVSARVSVIRKTWPHVALVAPKASPLPMDGAP